MLQYSIMSGAAATEISMGVDMTIFGQFPAIMPAGGAPVAEHIAPAPVVEAAPIMPPAEQRGGVRRWAMAGVAGLTALALAGCGGGVPFVSDKNKHHGAFYADFAAGAVVYADHDVKKACGRLASAASHVLVWRNIGRQAGSDAGGFDKILGVPSVESLGKINGDCGTMKHLDLWIGDGDASNRTPAS